MCTACNSKIGVYINRFKAKINSTETQDAEELFLRYREAKEAIYQAEYKEHVTRALLEDLESLLNEWTRKSEDNQYAIRMAKQRAEEEEAFLAQKDKLLEDMIVTSGDLVEGYHIKRYGGIISSGSTMVAPISAIHRDFKKGKDDFTKTLLFSQEEVLSDMMEETVYRRCNAIIRADFDYIPLMDRFTDANNIERDSYFIQVIGKGTAVFVEKDDSL